MTNQLRTVSPVDGRIYVERSHASEDEIAAAVRAADDAQGEWRRGPLAERARLVAKLVDAMVTNAGPIAEELTLQMGRPICQTPGEVRGFAERARHMIDIAEPALADIQREMTMPSDPPTSLLKRIFIYSSSFFVGALLV